MPCDAGHAFSGSKGLYPTDFFGPSLFGIAFYFDQLLATPGAFTRHDDQMIEWNGGPFDPTALDHEAIGRRLRDSKR